MSDRVRKFLEELQSALDRRELHYWWADHQWLLYVGIFTGLAAYSIGVEYMKLRMLAKIGETSG